MTDMIVSGAGSSTVNGTYVENGTLNGKPLYIMQGQVDYPRIYFDPSGAWLIYAFNSYKGLLYNSNESVGTPDLCTTWNVSWGTSPAPTVTAASSGQSLTLSCAAGSYSLTGTNADLTVTRHYTLTCEAGSYSLTGTNADFEVQRNYALACSAGNYLITGTDVTLTVQRNYTLVCEPGSYTYTGTDITFGNSKAYSLTCEAGAYLLTGADIEMLVTYILLGSVAILPNLFALGAKGKRVSIRPTNGRIKL